MESSIEHLQPLETNISDLKSEVIIPVVIEKKTVEDSNSKSEENETSLLQKHSTLLQVTVASLVSNYIPSETLLSIPGVSKVISTLGESPIRTLLVILLFLLFQFFL